jgi:methylenetetrahydrofolate dehydrogenase (NADP+)/methenyltetrahydrofolate cyclohydrolase
LIGRGALLLKAGPARAAIAALGGEWRQWSIAGVDLLWPGDVGVWPGVAPVLFPVVGWTRGGRVRVGAADYALGLHGFAAEAEFAAEEHGQDYARLVLRDSAQTLAVYPFAFRLEIEYRLSPTAMEVIFLVANTGSAAMPYAVGLHPGFRWPLAGSGASHKIVFEALEPREVPVIAPGGLFSARKRPVPLQERTLRLTPALFAEEALCFRDLASRKLLYDSGAGQGLLITMQNFPHAALWARPPAPFLAIEAWTGYGDPEDFDGDLFDKPSMIVIGPGAQGRHAVRYEFIADMSQSGPDLQPLPHLPKRPEIRGRAESVQAQTAPLRDNDEFAGVLRPSGETALLIDGRAAADRLLEEVRAATQRLAGGVKPGLATILVGEDPASRVYVSSKGKAARGCGFHSIQHDLAASASEADLLALIRQLNQDPTIHGILVQLPLPKAIDPANIVEAIAPEKDVDGFSPVNVGRIAMGQTERAFVPCTPAGALLLIEAAGKALGRNLQGAAALIVGRSNIVGKPMAQLLLQRDATVTTAHSRTEDLPALVGRADILVAAIGRAEMIGGAWVKPGAIVIDVGINRVPREAAPGEAPKTRLVGDVGFAEAVKRAGAITPVPGGVGPMTIAMLMVNTLRAAKQAER